MPLVKCEHCSREFKRQLSWIGKRVFCNKACRKAAGRRETRCEYCGHLYQATRSQERLYGPSRYCSRLCQNRAKGKEREGKPFPQRMRGKTLACPGCGKAIHVRPSEEARGWRRYCSDACYWSDPNRKTNKGKSWSDESKKKMSEAAKKRPRRAKKDRSRVCIACYLTFQHGLGSERKRNHRFCSSACRGNWLRANPWECPTYIDGKTSERQSRGPNWRQQRSAALTRDVHQCQHCGRKPASLHVHHIVPWRAFFNDHISANALSNLVTLCNRCHIKIECYSTHLRWLLFAI